MKERLHARKNIVFVLLAMIGSAFFVYLFSYSTSPLYPYFYGNDSAHFMTVGKAWLAGKIPYRDMFDHKGPMIYFIDMLGYLFRGDKSGIAGIQVAFMTFTLIGLFKLSQLETNSTAYGVMAVVITLAIMKINYVEGNSVEEYCLPFLTWSSYGILCYFKRRRICHAWKWTILYGITAGISLLTRVTNFIPLCIGIFMIAIFLIAKREFINLLQNAGAFLLGFAIVFMPFAAYFVYCGAWDEAVYAVIQFNIEYSAGTEPWYRYADSNAICYFAKVFFDFYIIFIAAGIRFWRKDYKVALLFVLTGMLEGVYFMKGFNWPQYALICLPQVVILINEVVYLLGEKKAENHLFGDLLVFLLGFLVLLALKDVAEFKNFRNSYGNHNEREWERLVYEVPRAEMESFVAYGGNEFKELYLLTDTMPCYKYYMIEPWICSFSGKIKKEVYDIFNSGRAKWIISDEDTCLIDDILLSKYYVFDSTENYTLYRLKANY